MLKNKTCILFFIFSITLIAIPSFALDFKPGHYEITSKVEMPGMPIPMAPHKISKCMTDQDILSNSNLESQDCKFIDKQQTNNTVSWEMQCVQQGQKITSKGQIVYKEETFKGKVETRLGADAGNTTMTTVITGKRLSDCK